MNKKYLLILFYSASGSVKNLAHAIADGAEEAGVTTKIRTVPKVSSNSEKVQPNIPFENEIYCTKEDLVNCSGIAIGSPTRFGSMASPLKYFLDSTGDIWSTNALDKKLGLAFTSTGSMHGGQEMTLFNILTFMLHHGMVVTGTPYGPSHVEGFNQSSDLTPDEYHIAHKSGMRLAELIKKI